MTTSPHNENSKFDNRGKKPLHHRDDEGFIRELIWEIIRRKHYVRRESKHHIKVREVNYWPSTGTITIDGEGRHPEKGEQALLALLQNRYPKHRDTSKEAQATSLEFSSPPAAPIFNINLDDLDLPIDYDPVPSDSWDDEP
jgi:hypothetical protein